MARQMVAFGSLSAPAPAARLVCGECDLVGHLLLPAAAVSLAGVHDHLHHRDVPTAQIQPAELVLTVVPVMAGDLVGAGVAA